jgi:hypothetical protein
MVYYHIEIMSKEGDAKREMCEHVIRVTDRVLYSKGQTQEQMQGIRSDEP